MRTQLLLGRLSLQEQRITALNRQSSELQQQLTNVTRDHIATTEHLERLTTTLQSNTGPVPEQKELEYELSALKTRVVEQQQEEQRLQNQFAELSRTIAAEQGRLDGLQQPTGRAGALAQMKFDSRSDEPTNPRTKT